MDNNRTKFISVRLTLKELETLKELAYQARLSVSEYVRKVIFAAEEEIKDNEQMD